MASIKCYTSILWSVHNNKLKPKVYLSPCIVSEDIAGWGIPISPSFDTEDEALEFQDSVENLMKAYEDSIIREMKDAGVVKKSLSKIKKMFKEIRKTMER